MEKSLKEDMNRVYTWFSGEKITVDSYSVQVVLHHLLDGLLYSSVYTLDQKQIWSCEHTGKTSLAEYCQNHCLKKEEILWIYGGILENLLEIQEFLLEADSLYLDASEIYVDPLEKRVWNSYVPFYQDSVWKNMQELTQYLLGNLEQEDTETVQILYSIFHYLTQGGTDVDKIWKLLCGKSPHGKKNKIEEKMYDTGKTEQAEYVPLELQADMIKESEKPHFSFGKWVIASLPILLAVFICVFVALNEWYLSNQRKVLLLAVAAIFGGVGLILWKRWGHSLKKANLIEVDGRQEGKNDDRGRGQMEDQTEVLWESFLEQNEMIPSAYLVRKDSQEHIQIPANPSVIGKLPKQAQILIQEPVVSRIHAKISMRDDGYYLEDLNSKNGTYVNGERLKPQKPVRLCGDDVLVFANICYYFQLSNR